MKELVLGRYKYIFIFHFSVLRPWDASEYLFLSSHKCQGILKTLLLVLVMKVVLGIKGMFV